MLIQTEQEPLQVLTTLTPPQLDEVHEEEVETAEPVAGPPLSLAQMRDLRTRLANRNSLIHDAAESELFALDSAALTAFLAYERQMRARKMKMTGITFFSVFALTLIFQMMVKGTNLFIYYGMFSGMLGSAAAFTKAYKSGVLALTRFNSTESVGELIPALEIRDNEVQQTVRAALIRLLPNLRASDRKLITDANRRTLIRFLQGKLSGRRPRRVATVHDWRSTVHSGRGRRGRNTDPVADAQLTLAILIALQQVGDSTFSDIVSRIAEGWVHGADPEIAAAARECLPYLQQRTQESIASNELVRPSSATTVGTSQTLLRAVTTAASSDRPEELLRAGHSGDE